MIELNEKYYKKKAIIKRLSFHKTDMKDTHANIEKAKRILKWEPIIKLEEGILNCVNWYKDIKSLTNY